jgi:hypothetical protein
MISVAAKGPQTPQELIPHPKQPVGQIALRR